MAVIIAYFDESGDQSSYLLTSACMATAEKWEMFDREWHSILSEYSIPFFRLKEYFSLKSKVFRHLDEPEILEVGKRLAGAISRHIEWSLVVGMDLNAYNRHIDPGFKSRHGTPYSICLGSSVFDILKYEIQRCAAKKEKGTVHIVVEAGHKNAGDAISRLRKLKRNLESRSSAIPVQIGDITESAKTGSGAKFGIQAADVVGHLIWKDVRDGKVRCGEPVMAGGELLCVVDVIDENRVLEMKKEGLAIEKNEKDRKDAVHKLRRIMGRLGLKVHAEPNALFIGKSISELKEAAKDHGKTMDYDQ